MSKYIVATSNFNTIKEICQEAQNNAKMISIVGYPGAGKTTALEYYSSQNELCYYLRVEPSMSAKNFYNRILNVMGVEGKDIGTTLHDMINDISYRLNYNMNRKLIIIDEAGKFKSKLLEYLHELRDKTQNTTGIILAGPDYFHDNMLKWKNKGIIGVPELYRRINHWEYLSEPKISEARAICKIVGLEDDNVMREIFKSSENFAEIVYKAENYLLNQEKIEIKTVVK